MGGFEWCKKRSILYRAVSLMSQHANAAQYFTLLKQESKFTLGLNTAKKYTLYQEMLQIKVVKHEICCKKLSGRICISPPGVELVVPNIAKFGIL